MTSHLQDHEVCAVVELALGIDERDAAPVGWELYEHLAACEECREQVGELSAIVAGDDPGLDVPAGAIVDFLTAATPDYLQPEASEELLAAAHEDLAALAHFEAASQRTLESADHQVQLSVRLVPSDHSCRVYPAVVGSVKISQIAFLMPPGVVCNWPERSYFRYPGEAYGAIDWEQVKLLYPAGSKTDGSGDDPA